MIEFHWGKYFNRGEFECSHTHTCEMDQEFIDQLTGEQFEKVTQFFQTMPKLSHKVSITNPKTNVQSEVVLEGLQSFLG